MASILLLVYIIVSYIGSYQDLLSSFIEIN